nr:WsbC [Anoxybacillus tepidamans]
MPLVSIVVATYFPRTDFFEKQLQSLNNQTYENIEIIICDDSANDAEYEKVKKTAENIISRFPCKVIRNEKNVGSNKTFERLTKEANGDYICYCDQDDIWLSEKVERLVSHITKHHCTLVYSDLSLIDENDRIIHKSFKRSNFRLKHVHGDNTFAHLINRNSVTGCAMMIRTDVAKSAIPFPSYDEYVHDHWLAICAAARGRIGYIHDPMVLYRMHPNNQIGKKRLSNIYTIDDYVYYRIKKQFNRYEFILSNLWLTGEYKEIVYYHIEIAKMRLDLSNKISLRNLLKYLKLAKFDFLLFIFEVLLFTFLRNNSSCFFKIIKYLKL